MRLRAALLTLALALFGGAEITAAQFKRDGRSASYRVHIHGCERRSPHRIVCRYRDRETDARGRITKCRGKIGVHYDAATLLFDPSSRKLTWEGNTPRCRTTESKLSPAGHSLSRLGVQAVL